jgi:hypothetical protein
MTDLYNLPDLTVSKDVIERIQFSVSSRNAEAKLSECATHVFAAQYSDNPRSIQWQYVASGAACLLRNRELHRNGRKYMWSMSLCLYNVNYGVLVWKAKLLSSCDYTAVADNFHVFALGEVNVVVGLLFSSREQACEQNTTYMRWHQERMRDDGKKGPATVVSAAANTPAIRFRKEQISKPCNFQHIQGTQALDECLEIEKIKADILAAFFGLGTSVGRSEIDTSDQKKKGKKKKDQAKSRLTFKDISIPVLVKSPPTSPPMSEAAASSPSSYPHQESPTNFEPQSAAHAQQPHPQDSMYSNFPLPQEGAVNDGTVRDSPPPPTVEEMAAYNYEQEPEYPRQPSLSYETEQYEHQQHYINLDPEPEPLPQSPQESYSNSTPYSRENSQTSHGSQPGGGVVVQHYANLEPAQQFVAEENPYDNLQSVTNNSNQQDGYGYESPPPRLDFNLEKELAESFLFQSPLTAN